MTSVLSRDSRPLTAPGFASCCDCAHSPVDAVTGLQPSLARWDEVFAGERREALVVADRERGWSIISTAVREAGADRGLSKPPRGTRPAATTVAGPAPRRRSR